MVIPRPLDPAIVSILEELIRSPKSSIDVRVRAEICLFGLQFRWLSGQHLSELTGVSVKTVRKHLSHLTESLEALQACAIEGVYTKLKALVEDCLRDEARSGRPPKFGPLQIVSIISVACESPEKCGRPISKWTPREIAHEAVKRGIVESISPSHVGRILRKVKMRPHKTKGWCFTTEKDREAFARQAQDVCDVYLQAPRNHEESGVHTVSVDEVTGLQANEKKAPSLPPKPGQQGKEETQYKRHGALCLMAAWDVVLGQLIYHRTQKTRNNRDFANFIEEMISRDPDGKWIIVLDNLNIHTSEALVRVIARREGIKSRTLGSKKKRKGILGSMKSRKAFLSDPARRIRFVFTPKHSSWLNQIEVIFGIIKRRALAGASFKSEAALIDRLNAFIGYYNTTFASPMNWTYTGRPTETQDLEKPRTWRQRSIPKSWNDHWAEREKLLAA